MLPKFATKRIGISIDDPNVPTEVLVFDDNGNKTGVDLLAYVGYLHAALQQVAVKLDELEARTAAPSRP